VGIFLNPVAMANPAIAEMDEDSTSHSSVPWKHEKKTPHRKQKDSTEMSR
jgi:hypothetical protein